MSKKIVNLINKSIVVTTIDKKRVLKEIPAGEDLLITAAIRLEEEAWDEELKTIYFDPVFTRLPEYNKDSNTLYIVTESSVKYLKCLDRPLNDIIFPIVTKESKKNNTLYCTYFVKVQRG